jgi:hypothetical protein
MTHIVGQLRIERPAELVFDTVADSRNEPAYNPSMAEVELLTPPPIGSGTRFRARMGRRRTEMLVELTEFQRPRLLGSRTTSALMDTDGAITLTPDGEATVMRWEWRVRPRGRMRWLGPLLGPVGSRMERGVWTGLKRHLEADAPARTRQRP